MNYIDSVIERIQRYSERQGRSYDELIKYLKDGEQAVRKVYIVEHDGHVNSECFYSEREAFDFINSRIDIETMKKDENSNWSISYTINGSSIVHTWKIKELYLKGE